MPPALHVIALPSPISFGSVIDRLPQLRPPTALSSFGDTLSVLIRALIGRLAVGEWDQGHGGTEATLTFLRYHWQYFFLAFSPDPFPFTLLFPLICLLFTSSSPNIIIHLNSVLMELLVHQCDHREKHPKQPNTLQFTTCM